VAGLKDDLGSGVPIMRSQSDTVPIDTRVREEPPTITLRVRDEIAYRTARIVIQKGEISRSVVIGLDHVRIGKSLSNDVVLDDPHASRFHCEIRRTAKGYVLRDLDSMNGTRVGDVEVKEGVLHSGATIVVGDTRMTFLADEGSPSEVVVSDKESFGDVHGRSVRMREVFSVLERIAPTDLTVLLLGETGSGKDVVAQSLHAASPRKDGPMVVFDCASVSPSLIESELFGHMKGAFTGANETRQGAFERAHGGTLFLDEIGELSLELQPRLLRALEQRTVRRVGGAEDIPVDVRIIVATHRDLERFIRDGKFRQDLFFRLSVVTIVIPPLRQRAEDLSLLIDTILPAGKKMGQETFAILARYHWPGNVRELRNVIDSAAALCEGDTIEPRHLMFFRPHEAAAPPPNHVLQLGGQSLESIERAAIQQTLHECAGNKTRAAKILGISASTLYEKIKKYAI
jgi:transcriptional regulator with PAS, ATPase and Fis domain